MIYIMKVHNEKSLWTFSLPNNTESVHHLTIWLTKKVDTARVNLISCGWYEEKRDFHMPVSHLKTT
jgi:hypothetical protein